MGGFRTGIGGLRRDEPVRHEEVTLLPGPKMVMRQFVAEDGLHFRRIE